MRLTLVYSCHISGLAFDVMRNSPVLASQDMCAKLRCVVKNGNKYASDIKHVVSLTIFEGESGQEAGERIAGISSFDKNVIIYRDPAEVSATGHIFSDDGNIEADIKDPEICSRGVFYCELKFINDQKRGQIIKIEKRLQEPSKSVDFPTSAELKSLILSHLSVLGQQSENITKMLMFVEETMDQRLLRLEDKINEQLHARLVILDQKLDKLEMMLNDHDKTRSESSADALHNTTTELKNFMTDRFHDIQKQMDRLDVSFTNRNKNAEAWRNESLQNSLMACSPCEALRTNLPSILHQSQDYISAFKNEVSDKLSAIENMVQSSNGLVSMRLIVEALVMMSHNISSAESKLSQLKSDVNSEIKAIGRNISFMEEKVTNRHNRLSRDVKTTLNDFELKLARKAKEMDDQMLSVATLDREVRGKLVNFEISLKDIDVLIQNLKYIFRL